MKKFFAIAFMLAAITCGRVSAFDTPIDQHLKDINEEIRKLEDLRDEITKTKKAPKEPIVTTMKVGDWIYDRETRKWNMNPNVDMQRWYRVRTGHGSISGFGPMPIIVAPVRAVDAESNGNGKKH